MRHIIAMLLVPAVVSFGADAGGPQAERQASGATKTIFKLGFKTIDEMSGIVKSERFEEVYWVHNDSGDTPRLFAIDGNGQVIVPEFFDEFYHDETEQANKRPWTGVLLKNAENADWEDAETDDNIIYIADTGNNDYDRHDLGVYMIPEPNPYGAQEIASVTFIPIRYPQQEANLIADMLFGGPSESSESMFIFRGKLYFLTKSRKPHEVDGKRLGTTLYRLDTLNPDESNELQRVEAHPDIHLPTGADLSPDDRHLAVLSYSQLWIFDQPPKGDLWLSEGKVRMLPLSTQQVGQVEGITWMDNETLLFGNEPGHFFTVSLNQIPVHRPQEDLPAKVERH